MYLEDAKYHLLQSERYQTDSSGNFDMTLPDDKYFNIYSYDTGSEMSGEFFSKGNEFYAQAGNSYFDMTGDADTYLQVQNSFYASFNQDDNDSVAQMYNQGTGSYAYYDDGNEHYMGNQAYIDLYEDGSAGAITNVGDLQFGSVEGNLLFQATSGFVGINNGTPTRALDIVSFADGVGVMTIKSGVIGGYNSLDIRDYLGNLVGGFGMGNPSGDSPYKDGVYFAATNDGAINRPLLYITGGSVRLSIAPDGDISAHSNYIQDVLDPVNAQDVATKAYVDAAIAPGIDFWGQSGTILSPYDTSVDTIAFDASANFEADDFSFNNDVIAPNLSSTTDKKSLTAQVAQISATAFTTDGAGLYRVSYYLQDTTAGLGAGTLTMTVAYNDDAGADTQTTGSIALSSLSNEQSGSFIVQSTNGTITYQTDITGIFSTATYSLYMVCEKII